jgi:hypothetical protein
MRGDECCKYYITYKYITFVLRLQVLKYQELAAEDVRFNTRLADACSQDRQSFCSNVPPVRVCMCVYVVVVVLACFVRGRPRFCDRHSLYKQTK